MTTRNRKPNKVKIRGVAANLNDYFEDFNVTDNDRWASEYPSIKTLLKNMENIIAKNPNYDPEYGEFPVVNKNGIIDFQETLRQIGYHYSESLSGYGVRYTLVSPESEDVVKVNSKFLNKNKNVLDTMVFNRMMMSQIGSGNVLADQDTPAGFLKQIRTVSDVRPFLQKQNKNINDLAKQYRAETDVTQKDRLFVKIKDLARVLSRATGFDFIPNTLNSDENNKIFTPKNVQRYPL